MSKENFQFNKWLIIPIILIILVGLYVYFIDSTDNENTLPKTEQVTIRVIGEDSSNLSAIATLAKEYKENTGVNIEIIARSFEEAFTKSNQDFVNHSGLYSIVLQYNFALNPFVSNDYVYKLNELKQLLPKSDYAFESKIFEKAWKEVGYYQVNDKIKPIAYPFATNTMLLVYNKKFFNDERYTAAYEEQSGVPLKVPTTWDEYKKVAEFFSRMDSNLSGVALQGAAGGWAYYEWATILQGFGQTVMTKPFGWESDFDTPLNLTSQLAIKATEYYLSLKETDKSTYINIDQNEQIKILKQDKAVMGLIWSDYIYGFFSDGNGNFDPRFAFVPVPGEHSPLAGGSFYINKDTKYAKEAHQFINYLMQEENQILLAQKGLISPMRTAYHNSAVKKLPYSEAVERSLERGSYAFEAGPDSDLISNVITDMLQGLVLNSEKNVVAALKKAEERIYSERGKLQ